MSGELALNPKQPGKSTALAKIEFGSTNALDGKLNVHLKKPEFFNAAQIPQSSFVRPSAEPSAPTTAQVNGSLTLKGVTKLVLFDGTFNQSGPQPAD